MRRRAASGNGCGSAYWIPSFARHCRGGPAPHGQMFHGYRRRCISPRGNSRLGHAMCSLTPSRTPRTRGTRVRVLPASRGCSLPRALAPETIHATRDGRSRGSPLSVSPARLTSLGQRHPNERLDKRSIGSATPGRRWRRVGQYWPNGGSSWRAYLLSFARSVEAKFVGNTVFEVGGSKIASTTLCAWADDLGNTGLKTWIVLESTAFEQVSPNVSYRGVKRYTAMYCACAQDCESIEPVVFEKNALPMITSSSRHDVLSIL